MIDRTVEILWDATATWSVPSNLAIVSHYMLLNCG
jgi:hypothetical protein